MLLKTEGGWTFSATDRLVIATAFLSLSKLVRTFVAEPVDLVGSCFDDLDMSWTTAKDAHDKAE